MARPIILEHAKGRKVIVVTCDRSSRAVAAPLLRLLPEAEERFVLKYTRLEVTTETWRGAERYHVPKGGAYPDEYKDDDDPTEFRVLVDDYYAQGRALRAMKRAMRLDLYLRARAIKTFRTRRNYTSSPA